VARIRPGADGDLLLIETTTDLNHNQFGSPIYIRCCEAEQAKSGVDKSILPAVVVNQSIAMIAAVEFNGQSLIPIEKVWAQ
jgi:hypothetical protein